MHGAKYIRGFGIRLWAPGALTGRTVLTVWIAEEKGKEWYFSFPCGLDDKPSRTKVEGEGCLGGGACTERALKLTRQLEVLNCRPRNQGKNVQLENLYKLNSKFITCDSGIRCLSSAAALCWHPIVHYGRRLKYS